MKKNPYRVLGPRVPPLMGRQRLLDQIQAHLDRDEPDHVSVVGPALYGKSVLLQEIAKRYRPGRPGYITSLYLDMRLHTPETDEEFRDQFAEQLRDAFETSWPEMAELLSFEDVDLKERLQLVARELAKTHDSVLAVLDGFDDVLANAGITRELWDGLLRIASEPVLRYVTGSRAPLRELCRTEESRTSDFWEIFHDAPVRVGGFEETDWSDLLEPFEQAGIEIEPGAHEEIGHWTGGVPVLAVAFLQSLWNQLEAGDAVTAEMINEQGERLLEKRRQILASIWEDCTAEMKTDLSDLTRRELRTRDLPASRLHELESRNLVRRQGKRVVSTCRLMDRFAEREAPGVGSLQRLFGKDANFEHNIRMLLELRLAQVPVSDENLHGLVGQAIRHLDPEPRHAMVWVRSIADRALDIVWQIELKDGVTIPKSWFQEWDRAGIQNPPDDGYGRVPGERGRQMRLLRYVTGTSVGGRTVKRLTRRVSRPTTLLIDHLASVGNFGQHQDDRVTRPFAVSVCLAAISLCASLAEDTDAS